MEGHHNYSSLDIATKITVWMFVIKDTICCCTFSNLPMGLCLPCTFLFDSHPRNFAFRNRRFKLNSKKGQHSLEIEENVIHTDYSVLSNTYLTLNKTS